jgi:uncharacterized Zn finger protein
MRKLKCPICHAKLEKAKEICKGGKKYLYIRCSVCYYEEKILLHKELI